jgi:ABC-type antimicrobial peptide transport system permease subunit
MNNLCYAFRQFAKSPGFTAMALSTLAICFAGIFFFTVLAMSAVVFFAIVLPARRAARVNPIDALRSE